MFRSAIGSLVAIAALAGPAPAGLPIPPRGTELRACAGASACADRVIVGRVTAVEKDHVKAKPVPGVSHQITYQIFRLAADETLAGGKAVTAVRIAGVVSDAPPVLGPEPNQLPDPCAKGAEGLYFLALHHTGEFYTVSTSSPNTSKKASPATRKTPDATSDCWPTRSPACGARNRMTASRPRCCCSPVTRCTGRRRPCRLPSRRTR